MPAATPLRNEESSRRGEVERTKLQRRGFGSCAIEQQPPRRIAGSSVCREANPQLLPRRSYQGWYRVSVPDPPHFIIIRVLNTYQKFSIPEFCDFGAALNFNNFPGISALWNNESPFLRHEARNRLRSQAFLLRNPPIGGNSSTNVYPPDDGE